MSNNQFNQSNNPEELGKSPESLGSRIVEEYVNPEKITNFLKNPRETIVNFAVNKFDAMKIGMMQKASEWLNWFFSEWWKKIAALLEKFSGIGEKLKKMFMGEVDEITNWVLGGVLGILGMGSVKEKLDSAGDFVKEGTEKFLGFLESFSITGVTQFTDKIKTFVSGLDLKKTFTNPQEVYEEIKERVAQEFPEVGYYFAIAEAEKIKNQTEKVKQKQVAMFDYAIGHFKNKPEIQTWLTAKLGLLKEKVENWGYESLTEDDWENLEQELKKDWYELKEKNDGLYYFNKQGGEDQFMLGYPPNQTIQENAKKKVDKLAIDNAYWLNANEGIDAIKSEILEPLKGVLSPELNEHLENYEMSLVWYKQFFDKLELAGIPHIITTTGVSFFKGGKWYVIKSWGTMGELIWDFVKIPFTDKKWDKEIYEGWVEFTKNVVPIMIMGGALWGITGVIKIPFRMAEGLVKGNPWALAKIPMDVIGGGVKGFTAPYRISKNTFFYAKKTIKQVNEIGITLEMAKDSAKHIPKTTIVKAQHLWHQVKTPFRATQRLFKLRHKDELLYQEILEYKKLNHYYDKVRDNSFFDEWATKRASLAKKRYTALKTKIKNREGTILNKTLFKGSLEKYNKLVSDKLGEIDSDPNLRKRFFEYLRKNKLISADDMSNFYLSDDLKILGIKEDWYKKEAITQLRKDWKLGPIKTFMTKIEEGLKTKIGVLKKSKTEIFKPASKSSTVKISEELAKKVAPNQTPVKPNHAKSAEKIIKNELGNNGVELSSLQKRENILKTHLAQASNPQKAVILEELEELKQQTQILETVEESVDSTTSQSNVSEQKAPKAKTVDNYLVDSDTEKVKASESIKQTQNNAIAKQERMKNSGTPNTQDQARKKIATQWTEVADDSIDDLAKLGQQVEAWKKAPTNAEIQKIAQASGEVPATTEQLTKDRKKIEKLWEKISTKMQDPQMQTKVQRGMAGVMVALFLNGLSKAEDKGEFVDEYSKHGATGFAWFKTGTTIWKHAAGLPVLGRLWVALVWAALPLFGWQYLWEKTITQPTTKYLPNLEKYINDMDLDTLALGWSLATGAIGAGIWGATSIYGAGKVTKHILGWGLDIDENSDPLDYLNQTATGIDLKTVLKEGVNQYHFTNVSDWNKEVDEAIQETEKKAKFQEYKESIGMTDDMAGMDLYVPQIDYKAKLAKLKTMHITPEWFQQKENELNLQKSLHESLLDEFIQKTQNPEKTQIFINHLQKRLFENANHKNVKRVQNVEEKALWKELCDLEITIPTQWKQKKETITFVHLIGLLWIDYNQQSKITQIKQQGRLKDKQ